MIREIKYKINKVVDGIEYDVTDYITAIGTMIQAIPPDSKLDPYVFHGSTLTMEGILQNLQPQEGDIFNVYIDGNKMFEGVVPKHYIFKKENQKVEFEVFSYMYAMKKIDASYYDFVVRSLKEYIQTKLNYTGYNQILDFDNYINTDDPIQSFIPPEFYKDGSDYSKIGAIYVLSGSPPSGNMIYAVGVGKHLLIYSWSDYGATNTLLLDYATGENLDEAIYDDIIKTTIDSEDYLIALLTINYKSSENGVENRVLYEVVKVKISDYSVTTDYPHPYLNNPSYFKFWAIREGNKKMWVAWNEETGAHAGRLWYAWYSLDTFNMVMNIPSGNRYVPIMAISDNKESDNKFYLITNGSMTNGDSDGYCLLQVDVSESSPYASITQNPLITNMKIIGNRLAVGEENDMYYISSWHEENSGFENGQLVKINMSNYSIYQVTNKKTIAGLKHFNTTPGLTYTEIFINSGDENGWELRAINSSGISHSICSNIKLTINDRNRIWFLDNTNGYRIMLFEDENVHALQAISKYTIKTVFGKMQYSVRKAFEELAKAWNCIFFVDYDKNIYFVDASRWIARNRITYNIYHYIECMQSTLYDLDYVRYNGYIVGTPGVTVRGLDITAECLQHIPHLSPIRAQAVFDIYGKLWNYWQLLVEHDGNPYHVEDYVKFASGEGIIKGVMVDKTGVHLEVVALAESGG